MRRDAEGKTGDFFQEKRSMRCAIGKMNVNMIDSAPREERSEVESIACTLRSLDAWLVFLFVPFNQFSWPSISGARGLRVFLPDSQNLLVRRVMNWRT